MVLTFCLIVGGIVGWLATQFVKGESYGLFADIAIGVIGGVIGGWVFAQVGITGGGLISSIMTAIIGAVVLIAALRAFKRAYPA
jgi:uncharacterized membrane protein YeaQ/YmgE (transglycosylase-associated protein family)